MKKKKQKKITFCLNTLGLWCEPHSIVAWLNERGANELAEELTERTSKFALKASQRFMS